MTMRLRPGTAIMAERIGLPLIAFSDRPKGEKAMRREDSVAASCEHLLQKGKRHFVRVRFY